MTASRLAVVITLIPAAAVAQTANGSPTAPAPPGLVGTPRPVSRTAPTVGRPKLGEEAASGFKAQPAPAAPRKETAAERADRLKLERDMHICIGC